VLSRDWPTKKEEMPRERPRPRERVEGRARAVRRRAGMLDACGAACVVGNGNGVVVRKGAGC